MVARWDTPLSPNLCAMGRNTSLNPLLGCLCHVFLKKTPSTQNTKVLPSAFLAADGFHKGSLGGPSLPQFGVKAPPFSNETGERERDPCPWAGIPRGALRRWCGAWLWVGDAAYLWRGKGALPTASPLPIRPLCTQGRLPYFKIFISK